MPTGTLLACIIEQALTNLFPDRLRPVQPHGVSFLNLDNPTAPTAGDPQQMPRDL
jgi:hypothetical protein